MNRQGYSRNVNKNCGKVSMISYTGPREKIKDCCRKFIAFMCTQVGVGGLLISYTLVGAATFLELERHNTTNTSLEKLADLSRQNCSESLFNIASDYNIFNYSSFITDANKQLLLFQKEFVVLCEKGYKGANSTVWTYPSALMFSLSTITMIGYGNMVPKSGWGKAATVVYAMFGIPLYILYFLNMGKVMSRCFKAVYKWLYDCSTDRIKGYSTKTIIVVPSTACLWVMGAYILTGTVMFANWEKWPYLDSAYFCVTSLCKLGFGDLVPGVNIQESKEGNYMKLIITFVYMLIGLGIVAMCYNLLREQVTIKVNELCEDITQCIEDIKGRLTSICNHLKLNNCT